MISTKLYLTIFGVVVYGYYGAILYKRGKRLLKKILKYNFCNLNNSKIQR